MKRLKMTKFSKFSEADVKHVLLPPISSLSFFNSFFFLKPNNTFDTYFLVYPDNQTGKGHCSEMIAGYNEHAN